MSLFLNRRMRSLREIFPRGRFRPPATELQIAEVESQLGVAFPEQLRLLYLECDGFREDRGNSKYLLSLTEKDFIGSLLETTRWMWTDVQSMYPEQELRPHIWFGFASYDSAWGINWRKQIGRAHV